MKGTNNFITRPNASNGYWLMFLLPISIIISSTWHYEIVTPSYNHTTLFSLGLIFASLKIKKQKCNIYQDIISALIVGIFFKSFLKRGLFFSLFSGLASTVFYQELYYLIFKKMPKCFTIGEAAICTQAITILLYTTCVNIYESILLNRISDMKISTLIIQVGLIGLVAVLFLLFKLKIRNPFKFWLSFCIGITFLVLIPLRILIRSDPLLWITNLFIDDLKKYKISLVWVVCSIVAIITVNKQISGAQKASTTIRKVFHILSVIVFVSGLLYNCTMLYLASGVVLGVFLALETIRILDVPPLSIFLSHGMVVFSDEKDAGNIALTPLYLLAGCALPLWIHPSPCDVTNSAIFNLLPLMSGVLTIGIGDTAASFVGSRFGRFHWRDSRKTIEGTIAFVLFQGMFLVGFSYLGLLKFGEIGVCLKVALAVIITGIIEAKTDQVDNLVLPFVMYIILSL